MRPFSVIALVAFAVSTSALAQAANDKLIVPGERIGPATVTMSLDQLTQAFGPKQGRGRPNTEPVLQQPATAESHASAVHRFDHLGLRAVTAAGSDNVHLIATFVDIDPGFATKEGVRIGSSRADIEAAYGKATAVLSANPKQVQMIYDDRGLGLRLTDENKVDLIQVFRPGAARERWKF